MLRPSGERADLRFGRLLLVWAPLALTFLLVTGGTPIANASINRLPGRDHALDLAAFALFLQWTIVLHSPLFVTREIAIKLSVNRAGSRRALRFGVGCAAVIAAVEIVLGATPLGARLLGAFADDPTVIAGAHEAFLYIWPVPFCIAVRAVYQAHQIRVDDTLFVAAGTLVRLAFTAVLGLRIAPHLGIPGALLGALCVTGGIAVETVFAVVRARARAVPPLHSAAPPPSPFRFGLPLMFANALGVASALFFLRIAGDVAEEMQAASLAGFQEVKSLHWLLSSGAFALQSLTTAKVIHDRDRGPMLRFALLVGGGLTLLLCAVAFTPLRRWVLVDLMNEAPDGDVFRLAVPALMVAAAMPLVSAFRFTLRGTLIARGHTRAITLSTVTTLLLLTAIVLLDAFPSAENGALNAYACWIGTSLVELAVLTLAARA